MEGDIGKTQGRRNVKSGASELGSREVRDHQSDRKKMIAQPDFHGKFRPRRHFFDQRLRAPPIRNSGVSFSNAREYRDAELVNELRVQH